MEKSRSHQIDDLAKRVFQDALPPTWVPNEFFKDYAKDFHVEIGDDNGKLTGTTVIIQLKGTESAKLNKKKTHVTHPLERKHATYYADKVRDLPVFLIVVDVNQKIGWYVHLQPLLNNDQSWRRQDSSTVRLPVENTLSDLIHFRQEIIDSQRQMKLLHPLSIRDAVKAQIDRMHRLDSRFSVSSISVDGRNGQPHFHIQATEPVDLKFVSLSKNPAV